MASELQVTDQPLNPEGGGGGSTAVYTQPLPLPPIPPSPTPAYIDCPSLTSHASVEQPHHTSNNPSGT